MKNQSISSNYSKFENKEFNITYTTISGASFIINVVAVIIIFKKKVLKPLEIILLNIFFLNVIYALDQLVRILINITEHYHRLLGNEKAELFYDISSFSSPIIARSICFFIVFLTLQSAKAIMYPLKYNKYVTKSNTFTGAAVLHILAIILFITCTSLAFTIIDGDKLWMVLNCLIVIESVLIIMLYIMILYKIRTSKSMPIIVKSSKRPLKMAVIVSASFLISYIPIGFVFNLQQQESPIFFDTALIMLWIDSFVNPLVIIFDAYAWRRILRSMQEWMNSIFTKRKPHISP